jgi:DNA-binding transcriptional LysR family regulator
MDAQDLKVFEAVARHSGTHRAAHELNTVQSNVTMRIRQLEAELGTTLFERHSKGMRLTPAGRLLLPYAAEVQASLKNAKRAVVEDGTPRGPLVVGTLQSIFAIHLTGILSLYLSAFPDVDVALHTGTTPDILDQVLTGKLEGAFVYGPVEHSELSMEIIFEDELVILSEPSITSLKTISHADTRMIVLRAGWNCRRLETILAARGIEGLRILELGTLEAVFDCVSAGLGITLLPKALLNPLWHKEKIRLHRISGPIGRAQTVFVRRRDGFVSSALSSFLDSARSRRVGLANLAFELPR